MKKAVRKGRVGIVGAVLAGGTSRRYGREKAMLLWRGKTYIEIAVSKLMQLCDRVVVSTDRKGRFEWDQTGAGEVVDLEPGGGAAVGILSVLRAFDGMGALVVPVDMPLLPLQILRRLLDERGASDAVVLKGGGRRQPLVGVYEPAAKKIMERCLARGERRLLGILRNMKTTSLIPTADEVPFLININRPEDVALLEVAMGTAR